LKPWLLISFTTPLAPTFAGSAADLKGQQEEGPPMLDRPSTRLASTSNQIGAVLLTVAAGGGGLLWE